MLDSSAPPPPAQIHGMPMPMSQPDYSSNYPPPPTHHNRPVDDDNATIVEKKIESKDAGAMSFAHYIMQWVKFEFEN